MKTNSTPFIELEIDFTLIYAMFTRKKIPDIYYSCFLCGKNSTQQYSVSWGVGRVVSSAAETTS